MRSQERESKKLVKQNQRYICLACGTASYDYTLICNECHACETVVPDEEDEIESLEEERSTPRRKAKRLIEVSSNLPPRLSTGRKAWDIVLGGGAVRPSSILVPGPGGVGKSTAVLCMLDSIGERLKKPVLYGSAERPAELVKELGMRLGLRMKYLFINDSKQAEDMHDDILDLRPIAIAWDSIQRFRVNGSLGQVELTNVVTGAIESGERVRAVSFLISHVTKQEDFMGENGIGHDVDVIIHLKKVGENTVCVETREKNRYAVTPLTATEDLY